MIIVLIHVLIAISSIIATTVLAIFPSKLKLYVSYSLIASTLISGTILVLVTHSSILKTCITGLLYLAVVMAGVVFAGHRLAAENSRTDKK
jgi:hypothetical protein